MIAIFLIASFALAAPGDKLVFDAGPKQPKPKKEKFDLGLSRKAERETALFAGGRFWNLQAAFDTIPGVISTTVGYSGGGSANPTYEQVTSGTSGHREAVQVVFDPKKIRYGELLETFWKQIDPFDDQGQFCDKGDEYRSAVYSVGDNQKKTAIESKQKHSRQLHRRIVTEILTAKPFYPAEAKQQGYPQKNSDSYRAYLNGCARDERLRAVWGP